MSSAAPELEPEGRHRVIARALFGALLRFLACGLILDVVISATEIGVALVWDPYDFPPSRWVVRSYYVPALVMESLVAVSLGSLRLAEAIGERVRPDASYARKLAMGCLVAATAAVVTGAAVFQVHYLLGLYETGSIVGAFKRIAQAEWTGGSSSYYMRRTSFGAMIAQLTLPIALTGFARARKLPLVEQVVLVALFVAVLFSPTFVFFWTFGGDMPEAAPWIVVCASYAVMPLLARLGDRLEARLTPRWLRPATPAEADNA